MESCEDVELVELLVKDFIWLYFDFFVLCEGIDCCVEDFTLEALLCLECPDLEDILDFPFDCDLDFDLDIHDDFIEDFDDDLEEWNDPFL